MEGKTHFLTGAVAGYLVTHDWRGALVGGIAGLLPDIDEPRSLIGRPFFFLSAPLNMAVGHRTLTHSLLAVLAVWMLLLPFSRETALAAVAGMAAHIFGDMLTGKVQLLWPVPISIGLSVPRLGYHLIDRTVRYGILLYLVWLGGTWIYGVFYLKCQADFWLGFFMPFCGRRWWHVFS